MSPVLEATLGGLIAAVCWGTGNYIVSKLSKHENPITINFATTFYGCLLVILVLLLSDVHMPTSSQLLTMGIAEIFVTAAYLLFVKALSSGTVGIVVPLSSTYPLIILLLSIAIIGATFSGAQIGAMVGIVIGAVVLAYEKNHKKVPLKVLHKESALAVSAALIWGVGFFFLNYVVDKLSWQVVMGVMYISGAILGFLLLVLVERKKVIQTLKSSLSNRSVLVAGPLLVAGSLGFYIGSDKAHSVVIPSVLSASEPLVTSFWAAVIDKEKVGVLKRIGAVIIVGGIILLNLS